MPLRYGLWTITHNPPPIPIRTADWQFVHDEYDGPDDDRSGYGPTAKDCIEQIQEMEDGDPWGAALKSIAMPNKGDRR